MWDSDHTLWKDDPAEITNRLGWLNVPAEMMDVIPDLEQFAAEVVDRGITDIVLLGMGGSSLGPEVLRQAIGSAPDYPKLTVLDSTVPAAILSVRDRIDPAKSLFLISSKSGGTIEPLSLYRYFRNEVADAVGAGNPGRHFATVTDPGTPLQALGDAEGFARIFLANPDIGGRYSVLSHFGIVPAALMGVDIRRLLESALAVRENIAAGADPAASSAWSLAAQVVAALKEGRDKLTIATGGTLPGFGLWAEQLLAESTGKEGKGVIPIATEPLLHAEAYGPDRIFVGPDRDTDAFGDLIAAGHPAYAGGVSDPYDLGGLFLAWEFATAVIGAELKINPFDQPNVQAAKDATDAVLADYARHPTLPPLDSVNSLPELLSQAREGDYLAIMPFVAETDESTAAFNELRRRVMAKYRIATTLGYGPRFLHSTGQLHKGGPNSLLAFQVTAGHARDVDIPDAPYSFGTLVDAQAIGDFQALQAAGRRVARLHVDGDLMTAIDALAQAI
ncbi:MAG: glucose-6-phosphate isomerase [Chloroflexi bacterium]|nr:glucose-6-phosphate isomerase [Chloroflexota bacterium]